MLNQQLIEDMFQDEASKQHLEQGLQQCSLNYTVSSRTSKHKKQSPEDFRQLYNNDPFDINSLALGELSKFYSWHSDSQIKFQQNLIRIGSALLELENSQYQEVSQEELDRIKSQIFKKQNQPVKSNGCKECPCLKDKIKQLQSQIEKDRIIMTGYEAQLKQKTISHEVQETMEVILSKVEINFLNNEIKQLQNDVSALKNQKYNLEVLASDKQRTSLFDKTKNSDLPFRLELQKSKGLSAAKNSTNSSQLTRHQETIVFIDPVESDVEEWIKFFEIQKTRYMNLCKREENQRMKALGRSFSKQQKNQLHLQGRVFIIFASIKDIWKNLIRIRQHTKSFLAVQSSKNFLKQRFNSHNQPQNTQPLKDENQKLCTKIAKLTKLNEYLQREKQNLNDINEGLKKQMVRQNILHTNKEKEIAGYWEQIQRLRFKIFETEQGRRVEGGLTRK